MQNLHALEPRLKISGRIFKVINFIRKLSMYSKILKSGTLVIRIGSSKKYFHVCNYPKLGEEGYGVELTKGKTMAHQWATK